MTYCATQSDIFLHHLAFSSPDPERLAQFYGDVMVMTVTRTGDAEFRCEGPDRRMIIGKGEAKNLIYAGFACRNKSGLLQLRAHAERQGVPILSSPTPYFGQGAFCVADPDGNNICFGLAEADAPRTGLQGPIQHLTFASLDVEAFQAFYHDKLGFEVPDRVLHADGSLATCFTTANHEHHTIACFKSDRVGVDHHSYEAGEWNYIRDWCDHFGSRNVQLMWGPGRHGPGNNLFIFIEDPDGNWIEVSAELEVLKGRPTKNWPQSERTLNLWGRAILRS
jgi:catechol 2,3-dioxygenase